MGSHNRWSVSAKTLAVKTQLHSALVSGTSFLAIRRADRTVRSVCVPGGTAHSTRSGTFGRINVAEKIASEWLEPWATPRVTTGCLRVDATGRSSRLPRESEAGTLPLVLYLKALDSSWTLAWSTASLLHYQSHVLLLQGARDLCSVVGDFRGTSAWDSAVRRAASTRACTVPSFLPFSGTALIQARLAASGATVSVIGTVKGIEKEA